ncbi:MAG: hypothetical protein K6D59_01190 [Bacteroidales bacterium]|nr:hypothetical protein [Bacteroidales bacterium]
MSEKSNNKKGRLAKILGGDMLESQAVLKQIPLMLVIVGMCLITVGVRYRVESLNKEKNKLAKNVSYMRERRVQMQKRYQESIRISRIDQELDTLKVGLGGGPPFEIKVTDNK